MKYSAPKRSLATQLLLLGAIPAVLMFLGLMIFFTTARLSDARQDLFDSTQKLADNLAHALEYAVVAGNRNVLTEVLERTMEGTSLEWIRVTDVVGDEIGFVGQEGNDQWPGKDSERPGVHRFSSDVLQQPVELGDNSSNEWYEPDFRMSAGAVRVGSVAVAVSERQLGERRTDILLTSGVVGVSLLVFTLMLVNRLSTGLLEPLRALTHRVQEMNHRNYRKPGTSHAKVLEIAEVEENLNQLARNLAHLQESRDQTLALSEGAREKAESANRAKSEFLALMSHELRTPLNGVLAMVELVFEEPLSESQADYLNTARQSTEDLLTLITDILDVSRLDQGTLLLENRLFNPGELAENCLASFRHAANQRGLALALEFSGEWPEQPEVSGDAARYRQVLASLLDNAVKFSDHGQVHVTMDWHREAKDCVFITCEVRDNGDGIPAEQLSAIFDSFEQGDSSLSRPSGGTGIGLTLVQRLVELMGGHVRLQSHPGQGTDFRFEVPFDLPPPSATSTELANEPDMSSRPMPENSGTRPAPKALVVEDNPVNQRVAKALLDRLGFETETVSNGREAVKSVTDTHGHYTVILMDCHMPVMDGFSATQAIRDWESRESRRQIPIIALTADALPSTEHACLNAGMNDYLAKPVRKNQLRAILSRWVPL